MRGQRAGGAQHHPRPLVLDERLGDVEELEEERRADRWAAVQLFAEGASAEPFMRTWCASRRDCNGAKENPAEAGLTAYPTVAKNGPKK